MATDRITNVMLQDAVDRLNNLAGHALRPYDHTNPKEVTPNAGNYHISGAYNAHALYQMAKVGTGESLIFGFTNKRNLLDLIQAFSKGMDIGKHINDTNKE
jgi:hypothetical protein